MLASPKFPVPVGCRFVISLLFFLFAGLSFWNGGGIIRVISNENLVNLGTETQKIPGQSKPVIYTSLPQKGGISSAHIIRHQEKYVQNLADWHYGVTRFDFNSISSTYFLVAGHRVNAFFGSRPEKLILLLSSLKTFLFSIWKHRKNDHLKILLSSLQDRLCPKIAECMARENMRHKNL